MTPYKYRQLQKKMMKVYKVIHLTKLFFKFAISQTLLIMYEAALVVLVFLMIVGLLSIPTIISTILM